MKRNCYSVLALVLFLAAAAQPLLADEWFTHHHDYQRTGVSSIALNETTLTRVWMFTEPINLVFFSNPVVAFNRVFYVSTSNSGLPGRVVCLDVATGDTVWTQTLVGGTGLNCRGTPTVAVVDTGGGNFDTVVYVPGGSGGFGKFYCFDFETGDTVWVGSPGGAVRFGPSVVAGNKVIVGHDLNGLTAFNLNDGSVAWTTPLVGRPYMSPSSSNDTIFCGTWDVLGGAGGNIYSIDANTGAIIDSFDPGPGIDFSSGVLVWGNNVIAVSQDVAGGGSSQMFLWRSHDLSVAPELSALNTGINLYSTPCGYVTDQGDSIVVWAQEYPGGLIKARRLSTLATYFNILPDHATFDVSVAMAANGLGIVGDNLGRIFFFDADTSSARVSNRVYYTKDFITPINSAAAIAGSDTILVLAEQYGNVFGYKMSAGTRPRTSLLVDQIDLNIKTPGSGSDTMTLDVYQNSGNGNLTYTVTDTVFTAQAARISVSPVNPIRKKMSRLLADELMITTGNSFSGKMDARMLSYYGEPIDYKVIDRASYIISNSRNSAQTAATDWLTVTDNSGGSAAPGGVVNLTLLADGTGLTRGFHDAWLMFTPTNEPDPTPYPGETFIMAPKVRLLIGFSYQDSIVVNPALSKIVTNYGALGGEDAGGNALPDNFNFNGTNELFDGTIILGNGPANLAMDVFTHDQTSTFPDTDVVVTGLIDSTVTYAAFIDNANLGVRVVQSTKMYQDTNKAGFVLYRLEITNTSDSLIPNFAVGAFFDWDVGASANNLGGMDTAYKVFYEYDATNPELRFGIMSVPFNSGLKGYELLDNNVYVYPAADLVDDSAWAIMSRGDFNSTGAGSPDDHSMLITFSLANLDSGATRVEEFALFGYDSTLITTDSLAKLINATATYVRERGKEIASLPQAFELGQNFPNPFNANTQIRFSVPKASHVKLEVYDILGRKVKTLADENMTAGFKQVVWDGKNESGDKVASGIYFYRIKAADYLTTKKMVLLK
jgi:outer membrane protein assembly factor BamB